MYGEDAESCDEGEPTEDVYGLLKVGMYGLIGTINGRVGISCRYWIGPCCALCGKYCIITGVGP